MPPRVRLEPEKLSSRRGRAVGRLTTLDEGGNNKRDDNNDDRVRQKPWPPAVGCEQHIDLRFGLGPSRSGQVRSLSRQCSSLAQAEPGKLSRLHLARALRACFPWFRDGPIEKSHRCPGIPGFSLP
jgi:hypothetical protein